MTALYEDAGLTLDEHGITIRRYYFPLGGHKRIAYTDIRGVKTEPMSWLSGKGRFWGRPTRATGSRSTCAEAARTRC